MMNAVNNMISNVNSSFTNTFTTTNKDGSKVWNGKAMAVGAVALAGTSVAAYIGRDSIMKAGSELRTSLEPHLNTAYEFTATNFSSENISVQFAETMKAASAFKEAFVSNASTFINNMATSERVQFLQEQFTAASEVVAKQVNSTAAEAMNSLESFRGVANQNFSQLNAFIGSVTR